MLIETKERNIMKSIGVAADSNCGMSKKEADSLGIRILPMPVHIGEQEYLEGVDLDAATFYQKQATEDVLFTSQPSPGQLMDFWDKALNECEQLLYIPMSSGLSGSCETAKMLAEDYGGKVLVVDNHRISITQRASMLEALRLAEHGISAEEIRAILEKTAGDSVIFLGVDTLKYLKKGGRVTPAAAAIGTVLNIRPVLIIDGGKLDVHGKTRGLKHEKQLILDSMRQMRQTRFKEADEKGLLEIAAATTCDAEGAAAWCKEVQEAFPDLPFHYDDLTMSVATHTGPNALGIGFYVRTEI